MDQTHSLTLEGVILPHQIPVTLRGRLPASRYSQPWGRRGRGCAAAVSQSETVANASRLQPPELPQCLGSTRWVSFHTDPNDSSDPHSHMCVLMFMIYRRVRSFWSGRPLCLFLRTTILNGYFKWFLNLFNLKLYFPSETVMLSAEVKQPQKCGLHVCENPVGFRTNGCNLFVQVAMWSWMKRYMLHYINSALSISQLISQSLTDIVK